MPRRLLVAVLGVLLVAVPGCGSPDSGGGGGEPDVAGRERVVAGDGTARTFPADERKPAPALTGELLDGGSFDLRRLRGDVVVVNFWASWCAPCRLEAPELAEVYRANKARGVQFVGINTRDDKDKARAFEESFGVPYPSLFDPAGRSALAFREVPPNAIPATIVIDREGRVAAVYRKALLREELEPAVRRIAAER